MYVSALCFESVFFANNVSFYWCVALSVDDNCMCFYVCWDQHHGPAIQTKSLPWETKDNYDIELQFNSVFVCVFCNLTITLAKLVILLQLLDQVTIQLVFKNILQVKNVLLSPKKLSNVDNQLKACQIDDTAVYHYIYLFWVHLA